MKRLIALRIFFITFIISLFTSSAFGSWGDILWGVTKDVVKDAALDFTLDKIDDWVSTDEQLFFKSASRGRVSDIKNIAAKGFDVNTKDTYGRTALFYAANNNQVEAVKLLIELGIDVSVKDQYGKKAIDYTNDEKIIDMLNDARSCWSKYFWRIIGIVVLLIVVGAKS